MSERKSPASAQAPTTEPLENFISRELRRERAPELTFTELALLLPLLLRGISHPEQFRLCDGGQRERYARILTHYQTWRRVHPPGAEPALSLARLTRVGAERVAD